MVTGSPGNPNGGTIDTITTLTNITQLQPEQKGAIFNTVVLANTDLFDDDIEPTNTPCTFRISIAVSVAGTISVRRTEAGATVNEELNAGEDLTLACLYEFNITVAEDQTINLQTNTGATILSCTVVELRT